MSNIRFTSRPLLWQLLVVVTLGSVYWSTLLPGPGYSGDTAKFQFVGYVLGTPHETGYPTYVLLNFVFTSIFPIGTIAFKANVLSAVSSVSAAVLLFELLKRFGVSQLMSFITTVSFGLGYTVWSQSVIAEVYALNLLFTALVLYCFIAWKQNRARGWFFAACASYAISFGNHLTMITFLPAIVFLVWQTDKSVFTDPKRIAVVFVLILLGAAQYSYVFFRSLNPATPYLEMSAVDWQSFWNAVSGGHFRHLLFGFSLRWMFFDRLPVLLVFILRELLFLLPFTIVGVTNIKDNKAALFFILLLAGNLIFCLGYAIYDIFIYLIPTYFVLAVFSGHGLQAISDLLKQRIPSWKPGFFLLIPAFLGILNFNSVQQRDSVRENDEVIEVLRNVGKDAVIVCPDYHYAMIFWYHIFVEKWKDNNIHIAFYHDQRFPSREISKYLSEQRRFYVPVTRDSIPSGLKAYVFLQTFDVRPNQPLGFTDRGTENNENARHRAFSATKAEFESLGVELREVSPGLFLATRKTQGN